MAVVPVWYRFGTDGSGGTGLELKLAVVPVCHWFSTEGSSGTDLELVWYRWFWFGTGLELEVPMVVEWRAPKQFCHTTFAVLRLWAASISCALSGEEGHNVEDEE